MNLKQKLQEPTTSNKTGKTVFTQRWVCGCCNAPPVGKTAMSVRALFFVESFFSYFPSRSVDPRWS
jgi:hypothetical protein